MTKQHIRNSRDGSKGLSITIASCPCSPLLPHMGLDGLTYRYVGVSAHLLYNSRRIINCLVTRGKEGRRRKSLLYYIFKYSKIHFCNYRIHVHGFMANSPAPKSTIPVFSSDRFRSAKTKIFTFLFNLLALRISIAHLSGDISRPQ